MSNSRVNIDNIVKIRKIKKSDLKNLADTEPELVKKISKKLSKDLERMKTSKKNSKNSAMLLDIQKNITKTTTVTTTNKHHQPSPTLMRHKNTRINSCTSSDEHDDNTSDNNTSDNNTSDNNTGDNNESYDKYRKAFGILVSAFQESQNWKHENTNSDDSKIKLKNLIIQNNAEYEIIEAYRSLLKQSSSNIKDTILSNILKK